MCNFLKDFNEFYIKLLWSISHLQNDIFWNYKGCSKEIT